MNKFPLVIARGKVGLWWLLLCLFPFGNMIAQTIIISPDELSYEQRMLLSDTLWYYQDTLGAVDVPPPPDHLFSPIDPNFPPPDVPVRQTAWFRFQLQNPSDTTDLNALLYIPDLVSYNFLWIDRDSLVLNGLMRNRSDRVVPDQFSMFPIYVPSNSSRDFALGIQDLDNPYQTDLTLELISYEAARYIQLKRIEQFRGLFFFYGCFFAILLYLIFFSLNQYRATRDKTYIYYSFYLAGLVFFYLRQAEQVLLFPIAFDYIAGFQKNIEQPLSYFIYLAYILFTRHFLDINGKNSPRLNRILLTGAYTFAILIVLDIIIQITIGLDISRQIYLYLRLLFFPFVLIFFWLLLTHYHSPLKHYIIIGTIFILLPSFFIVFSKLAPGDFYWYPLYRYYESPGGHFYFYMYIFQIGVILENICFSLGLSYRTRNRLEKAIEDRAETERVRSLNRAKDTFYTNITHEFRTPLTVINTVAEDLSSRDNKEDQQFGRLLSGNVKRSLNLIDQILELHKLEEERRVLKPVHADIIPWLQYLVTPFKHLASNNRQYLSFSTEIPSVYMDFDPEAIQRILENLLSNAIKFTEEEGKIAVNVGWGSGDKSSSLLITVSDSGRGIPPEQQQLIFERYYQLDPSRSGNQGFGIGLALVKKLTDLMNGRLALSSDPDSGSTFSIWLPIEQRGYEVDDLAPAPETLSDPVPLVAEPLSGSPSARQQVLIVEDEADVQTVLRNLLAPHYYLTFARNGREALKRIQEEIPHLIISDIMMPVMDGLSLCHQVKTDPLTCHIPIILLTARAGRKARLEGLEHGADAYLEKPFSREELFTRLQQLIELRKKLQKRYANLPDFSPADDPLGKQHDTFMQQAIQQLEIHHASSDFGPDELAKVLFISRALLYRKISTLTGMTVSAFINEFRLRKTHHLLVRSDLSIKDIAYQVGFGSPDYFGRLYKKKYGKTPSEARKDRLSDRSNNE